MRVPSASASRFDVVFLFVVSAAKGGARAMVN